MPVVQVGVMGMGVHQRRMHMRMHVGLAPVPGEIVGVPVMRVVAMGVRMLQPLVRVPVRMALGYVQPYASRHQQSRRDQLRRRCVARQRDGNGGPEERGD